MSQLSNNFNQFYKDKFVESLNFTITESEESASLKRLDVFYPNRFYVEVPQNKSILKRLWDKVHSQNKDCDGVAILGEGDEAKYLLLAELKSRLKDKELKKALVQIVISYLKMHSLFSLCKGYNSPLMLEGIIACSDDSALYSKEYSEKITEEPQFEESKLYSRLIAKRQINCELSGLITEFKLDLDGLNDSILNTPVSIYLTSQSSGDESEEHKFTLNL